LIGVVGIQVKAPTTEDLCENVAGGGNTLTGRTTDRDSEGLLHHILTKCKPAELLRPKALD
jgi:hypothetical protein